MPPILHTYIQELLKKSESDIILLNKYLILEYVAESHYGYVFTALDNETNLYVTIKIVPLTISENKEDH